MRKLLAFALIGLILTGCSAAQPTQTTKEMIIPNDNIGTVCGNGKLYYDNETELLMYYDLKLEKSIPLCDKLNCKHLKYSCSAWFAPHSLLGAVIYHQKLYYWHALDDTHRGYELISCDINGTNRKTIFKKTDSSVGIDGNPILYWGRKCYFRCWTTPPDVNQELQYGEDPNAKQAVASVDLNSGKLEILTEDVAITEGTLRIAYGEHPGTLYYSLAGKESDEFFSDYYALDLEAGVSKHIFQQDSWQDGWFFDGYYYYIQNEFREDSAICCINLSDGEKKILLTPNHAMNLVLLDNKLFYGEWRESEKSWDDYCYDLKNGQMMVTAPDKNGFNLCMNDETQDCFWGYLVDNTGTPPVFCWITKKDYYKGKRDYHMLEQT